MLRMTTTLAFAIPVLPGRTEAFQRAHHRFADERRAEFEASRRALGVLAEHGFLQHTPAGDLAVVVFEVEDPSRFLTGTATSTDALDVDFRAYLLETFGLDVTQPAGPPSTPVFEWRSRENR
jgi:hypothetical protein